MNQKGFCLVCRTHEEVGCECRRIIARYLQILIRVKQRRVSTRIDSSVGTVELKGTGFLDKLSGTLLHPLPVAELRRRAKVAGIEIRRTRLRDKRRYLQIGNKERGFYLAEPHPSDPAVRKMISRPSAFPAFADYLNYTKNILGNAALDELQIDRLDFAVDYPVPLREILRALDITDKRLKVQFHDCSGRMTGITVGSGAEKLVVYDRDARGKTGGPATRIEVQLQGRKLPAKSIPELLRACGNPAAAMRPFSWVTMNHIALANPSEVESEKAAARVRELVTLIEQDGWFAARRKLDQNRNFQRDYGRFATLRPWAEQPDDILARDLRDFLDSGPNGAKTAKKSASGDRKSLTNALSPSRLDRKKMSKEERQDGRQAT